MKLRKYTLSELEAAVRSSSTVRQVLQRLGIKAAGGNYRSFHKAALHYQIDTTHFGGSSHKGRKLAPRKPIAAYLVKDSDVQSHRLKRFLLERRVLEPICSCCGGVTWQGGPIPLELDHRNGDHRDNQLSNLRLLCPNCHALTPTYRGKNQGRHIALKA